MTVAIIPAHNEEATVGEVVRRVRAQGLVAVVVDDGSTDATAAHARSAGATVLSLPVNVGVGGALRTGFRYAVDRGHRRVVQVDADLQHDPSMIQHLLGAAESGHDLVIGSRFSESGYRMGLLRRLATKLLARLVSRRVGVALDDVTSGFRVISEPLLTIFAEEYPAEYLGDTVEALILAGRHRARITQVAVTMAPRGGGEATSSVTAAWHLLRILLVLAVRPRRRLAP